MRGYSRVPNRSNRGSTALNSLCGEPIRLIVRVRTMAPTRCASARQGRSAAPRSLLATTVTSEPDKNAALREESRSAAARDSTCSTRRPISFGYLQVQADPFTIDENEARLDQLLAGSIEVRVSA